MPAQKIADCIYIHSISIEANGWLEPPGQASQLKQIDVLEQTGDFPSNLGKPGDSSTAWIPRDSLMSASAGPTLAASYLNFSSTPADIFLSFKLAAGARENLNLTSGEYTI